MNEYIKTIVKWHDLNNDPEDLPGTDEPIIVTIETPQDGERKVWLDVVLHDNDNFTPYFCIRTFTDMGNGYGKMEYTALWYKVIAWAYPPNPYPV